MCNLECDPQTFAGPVDERVVLALSKRFPLSADYLECIQTCHGATPNLCEFDVAGEAQQVGLFLTLYDVKSELPQPFRPHFDHQDMDERVVRSVPFLLDYEHNTSRALFSYLLPFAAPERDMCLDRAYVNLLCFDYRETGSDRPPVVLWNADKASSTYMKIEAEESDDVFDDDGNYRFIPWDDFLTPVAKDFTTFTAMLRRPSK